MNFVVVCFLTKMCYFGCVAQTLGLAGKLCTLCQLHAWTVLVINLFLYALHEFVCTNHSSTNPICDDPKTPNPLVPRMHNCIPFALCMFNSR